MLPARTCERPSIFFDQDDDALERLPLQLVPPPLLLLGSDLACVTREVENFVLSEQARIASERAADAKRTLGAKQVLAADPFDSPDRLRTSGGLDPRLTSGGDGDVTRRAKVMLREFRGAYREAFRCLLDGLPAVFPYGTLLQRLRFRAAVEPAFQPPWCVAAGAT